MQRSAFVFSFSTLVLLLLCRSAFADSLAKDVKPGQKVCVYTIAKNEAKHIQRFAESASRADFVLVVDTGSEDNTVQLLKDANLTVVEKTFNPWRFDHARNFALQSLPEDCEIAVWQDLDEVYTPDDWPEKFRQHFQDPEVNNVLVHFVYPNAFDYFRFKAHRRKGFHYKYAVHEVFVSDDGIPMKSKYADDIIVLHLVDSTKVRNYIPLLELSLTEFPDEVPSHTFWLARDYYNTKQFEKAIKTFKTYLDLKTSKWAPERAAACGLIADSLWRLDRENQTREALNEREQNLVTTRTSASNSYVRHLVNEPQIDGKTKLKREGEVTGDEIAALLESWFIRGTQEAPAYRDPFLALANWYFVQEKFDDSWNTLISCLEIVQRDQIYLVSERAWTTGPYQDLAKILIKNDSLDHVWEADLNSETRYQILYQTGLQLQEQGRWSEAQEVYLEAWEVGQQHVEPLFKLMEFYYHSGSYRVAFMFGNQGKTVLTTQKQNPVFVSYWNDMSIWDYKFDDVYSVVAGLVGDLESGRAAAESASKNAPESDRGRIEENLKQFEVLLNEKNKKTQDNKLEL